MKSTHQATRVRFTPVLDQSVAPAAQPTRSEFTWIESSWFSTIAQQSPDLIGAVSLSGDWLCLNSSGKAMFATQMPPALSTMLSQAMQRLWSNTIVPQMFECGNWQGQFAMMRRSETVWLESQWFLIRDPYTHQPLGFATISREIEPPESDCNLLESAPETEQDPDQQKAHVLAEVAHDLKTPLSVISTSIDLLNQDQLSIERKQKHVQRIRSKIRQMTQVLDDILILSRSDPAEFVLQPSAIEPVRCCADWVEEAQLNTDRHEIMFSAESSAPLIHLDAGLLQRIVTNLLSNSIKYSPKGGKIACHLSVSPAELRLKVQDSGIGIPIAEQSQLFRSFYRASNAGAISGTGLGLAIVKKCVDRLKGQIAMTSVVQVGTCFTIAIPLRSSP